MKPKNMDDKEAHYAIGIDLGTTNSSLAYIDLASESLKTELLPVPQLVAAATIDKKTQLPSFIYLCTDHEKTEKKYETPFSSNKGYVTGDFARQHGAEVPARTVAAAKSWLCTSRVDRKSNILPWNAPEDVKKISPVEASKRLIQHLAAAWKEAFPKDKIKDQAVILTVPASFDAMARELTYEAACSAGLPETLVLLEEPQAAFYSWLSSVGENWRKTLKVDDTILVCDVGGGTTDFTLIKAAQEEGDLILKRAAVGNHILVGGDNMDLTLAHIAKTQFADQGNNLDPWQSVALWHACRTAKENILADDGPDKYPVTVLGRGSKLIGGTISVDIERDTVIKTLLNGFFPECDIDDTVEKKAVSGFKELGLEYERDTSITKHLARFLKANSESGKSPDMPTHILFNGGVFKSKIFRDAMLKTISAWSPGGKPPVLLETEPDYDLAVAKGSAHYGLISQGKGIRVRAGAARSYYIGIETAGLAVPGMERPVQALCVVPFGMEEGTEIEVPDSNIGLVVGEDARFRFFSSAVRQSDKPGIRIENWNSEEITEIEPIHTLLEKASKSEEGVVPVTFHSKISEVGVLELWSHSAISNDKWKLEFSVRGDSEEND